MVQSLAVSSTVATICNNTYNTSMVSSTASSSCKAYLTVSLKAVACDGKAGLVKIMEAHYKSSMSAVILESNRELKDIERFRLSVLYIILENIIRQTLHTSISFGEWVGGTYVHQVQLQKVKRSSTWEPPGTKMASPRQTSASGLQQQQWSGWTGFGEKGNFFTRTAANLKMRERNICPSLYSNLLWAKGHNVKSLCQG